jgi:hypothetical protein
LSIFSRLTHENTCFTVVKTVVEEVLLKVPGSFYSFSSYGFELLIFVVDFGSL